MSNQYPQQPHGQFSGGNQPPQPNNGGGYGYQQQPQGGYPQGGGPALAQDTGASGFFSALFDFSFSHFITPKVVKFVYILSTVALGLLYVFFVIAGFADSAGAGLAALILGPIGILLYLVFIRITLEFYLATVRMSEDIHNRLPRM